MSVPRPLFAVETYRMDESVGYLLARSRAMLAKALDAALAGDGVTHSQSGILLLLASGNCSTAADLVRETYTDAASMTRMLDRLQKNGLIERVPHDDDRRQVLLRLTDALPGAEPMMRKPSMRSNSSVACASNSCSRESMLAIPNASR